MFTMTFNSFLTPQWYHHRLDILLMIRGSYVVNFYKDIPTALNYEILKILTSRFGLEIWLF